MRETPEIMMDVVSGLLKGMYVGVTAACGERGIPALSRLNSMCGRMGVCSNAVREVRL